MGLVTAKPRWEHLGNVILTSKRRDRQPELESSPRTIRSAPVHREDLRASRLPFLSSPFSHSLAGVMVVGSPRGSAWGLVPHQVLLGAGGQSLAAQSLAGPLCLGHWSRGRRKMRSGFIPASGAALSSYIRPRRLSLPSWRRTFPSNLGRWILASESCQALLLPSAGPNIQPSSALFLPHTLCHLSPTHLLPTPGMPF